MPAVVEVLDQMPLEDLEDQELVVIRAQPVGPLLLEAQEEMGHQTQAVAGVPEGIIVAQEVVLVATAVVVL